MALRQRGRDPRPRLAASKISTFVRFKVEAKMRRVVPTQVVEYLRRVFPAAIFERAHEDGQFFQLGSEFAPALDALVELVDAIPNELQPGEAAKFEDLAFATSAIRHRVARWTNNADQKLFANVPGKNRHPIVLIYNALRDTPDEAIAVGTIELAFVADADLRNSIRQDISTATSALGNGEWKAATVLAGAAVEALLMWRLQAARPADLEPVRATLAGEGLISAQNLSLERWSLAALIRCARLMNVIADEAERGAINAQQFRNLIHPGRAQRLNATCHRGTALAALAAVHLVVADIG